MIHYSELKRVLELKERIANFDIRIKHSNEIFDGESENELSKALMNLRHAIESRNLSESNLELWTDLQQKYIK